MRNIIKQIDVTQLDNCNVYVQTC